MNEYEITTVLDSLTVFEWGKHIIIQLLKLAIKTLWTEYGATMISYEAVAIIAGTVLFGFIERLNKEGWVLFDSFKKAQKVYMRMIDNNPYPSFVITPKAKVLYSNEMGWNILTKGKADSDERKLTKGFCEYKGLKFFNIVSNEQKAKIEEILKDVSRECTIRVVELLLKTSERKEDPPPEQKQDNDQHGTKHDNDGSTKYLGYSHFNVTFKQFPWKQVNCILVICEDITEHKDSYSLLLQNNKLLKSKLKDLYSMIESGHDVY